MDYPTLLTCGKTWALAKRNLAGVSQYMVFPLHCHNWRCKFCAKQKAARVATAIERIFSGEQLYMLTLTWFHDRPPEQVWPEVGECWNRIRTAISKRYGAFRFVRVLETHKASAYPHLHVILTAAVEKKWIAREAEAAGLGFICDVRPCDSMYAGYYVRKYLSKPWPREDSWAYRALAGCRLWSASRGLVPKEVKEAGWSLILTKSSYDGAVAEAREHITWDQPRNTELVFSPIGECALVITAAPADFGPELLLDQSEPDIPVETPRCSAIQLCLDLVAGQPL